MASFSENAWDALNGALSICRGQMAGPALILNFKDEMPLSLASARTLEPPKEGSFAKPGVFDAGRAKDLPFDRIGAGSV